LPINKVRSRSRLDREGEGRSELLEFTGVSSIRGEDKLGDRMRLLAAPLGNVRPYYQKPFFAFERIAGEGRLA